MNSRYDQIRDFVEEKMRYDDVVCIWNEFCDRQRWYENIIHRMSLIDIDLADLRPSTLLRINTRDFDLTEKYYAWSFRNGEYSDIISSNEPFVLITDYSELVNYIDENDADLGNLCLRKFLDFDLEEEEEDDED